jgi:hypothetical protein
LGWATGERNPGEEEGRAVEGGSLREEVGRGIGAGNWGEELGKRLGDTSK